MLGNPLLKALKSLLGSHRFLFLISSVHFTRCVHSSFSQSNIRLDSEADPFHTLVKFD
jgi:hypothetical protein